MSDVVGTIKISFVEKGSPSIEILGDIPARQMNSLPIHMRRAIRKHIALLRKNVKKVDMSDKGKTLADLKKEELEKVNEPAPIPGADEINVVTPPVTTIPKVKVEEANDNEQEQEDGANSRTEETSGTSEEGPGSTEGPSWRK